MNISEDNQPKVFETVLPMINIVFLLLIFFMLAGAFVKPDALPVVMPEANLDKQADLEQLTVLMSPDKRYAIETNIYTEDELEAFINDQRNNNDKLHNVLLKADKNVKAKDLIATMELLSRTGLESVQLMSLKSSGN